MTETSSAKFYTLAYRDTRTYLFAVLFIIGNVLLPQMCHLVPGGGLRWLPIYFFTLIGAYKYGWRVGLLTAIASPLVNSYFFGMPLPAALPGILLKSVVLSGVAAYAAYRFRRASLLLLTAVVASYQFIGTFGEFVMSLFSGATAVSAWGMSFNDLTVGLPGLAVQVFLGYFVINKILCR